jgi:molybdopterin synthase catalytic subunit/molybdopterin converting factor small subunit
MHPLVRYDEIVPGNAAKRQRGDGAVAITVRLFAGMRELAGGADTVTIPADTPLLVRDLRTRLREALPQGADLLDRALIAINQQFADDAAWIPEGAEVAVIPPVGGGSPRALPSCMVTDTPLSVEEAFAFLEDANCGGTVLFCGTVREWTGGRQTTHLFYEAYSEMAVRQMERIEAEVKARWPGVRTLQWHRVGRLEPTDIAVICGASAPHRADAFDAARALIERLKAEVPIWKKEFYADGDAEWKENRGCGCEA